MVSPVPADSRHHPAGAVRSRRTPPPACRPCPVIENQERGLNMMDTTLDNVDASRAHSREIAEAPMARIFAATQPGVVFGVPVVTDAYTVITASEVGAGGGFGSGQGTGTRPADHAPATGGGGAGGGGGANGRPIA